MGLDKKVANKINPLPQSAYNSKKGRVGNTGSLPSTGKRGGASMGTSAPSAGKRSM